MAEAEGYPSFGGYDEEFVSAVDEDLQCPICHLPLKDAVQTEECGHRFCRKCLEGHTVEPRSTDTPLLRTVWHSPTKSSYVSLKNNPLNTDTR